MRHTPDAVRARLDELFEARLRGDAVAAVEERLRADLCLRVEPTEGSALRVAFRLHDRERRPCLRDGDPFRATYADEVDDLLRSWGVDPPDRYVFAAEDAAWDVYAATVDG
ncbi:MAG: hypothetical protein A07HB70_01154 [uncultured archaeon A07HB70]|nr:MAG: hypothetical protein A07HB70_01154 [uncultured archaeon A07HB70]